MLVVFVAMLAGLPVIGVGAYLVCVGKTIQMDRKGAIQPPRFLRSRIERFSAATLGKSVIVLGGIMVLVGLAMPVWVWLRMASMVVTSPLNGR